MQTADWPGFYVKESVHENGRHTVYLSPYGTDMMLTSAMANIYFSDVGHPRPSTSFAIPPESEGVMT